MTSFLSIVHKFLCCFVKNRFQILDCRCCADEIHVMFLQSGITQTFSILLSEDWATWQRAAQWIPFHGRIKTPDFGNRARCHFPCFSALHFRRPHMSVTTGPLLILFKNIYCEVSRFYCIWESPFTQDAVNTELIQTTKRNIHTNLLVVSASAWLCVSKHVYSPMMFRCLKNCSAQFFFLRSWEYLTRSSKITLFWSSSECYEGNGEMYRGTLSITRSGIPCADWSHHINR